MSRRCEEQGVSEIVGTILMVGVVTIAILFVAAWVLRGAGGSRERFVDFEVKVENMGSDNKEVKLIIKHVGGDTINSPANYLTVRGSEYDVQWTENRAYENENGFSSYGEFSTGDNAVLFIRHDEADVVVGDYYHVWIYDNYADQIHYDRVLVVQPGWT